MNFAEFLEARGLARAFDAFPPVGHSSLINRLHELAECSSYRDFEQLAELIWLRVDERNMYPDTVNAVYESVMELGNNAVEHSGTSTAFVAAQTYQYQSGTWLVVSVGDAGIGAKTSLASRHEIRDDEHALELAVTEGISGTGDNARGLGLSTVVEASTDLGGVTYAWSGRAMRTMRSNGAHSITSNPLPGMLVGVSLPAQPGDA